MCFRSETRCTSAARDMQKQGFKYGECRGQVDAFCFVNDAGNGRVSSCHPGGVSCRIQRDWATAQGSVQVFTNCARRTVGNSVGSWYSERMSSALTFLCFSLSVGLACSSPKPSLETPVQKDTKPLSIEAAGANSVASARTKANAAYEAKNYGACQLLFAESASSSEGRAKMNDIYSAACCAALASHKDEAFPLLAASIDAGFRDVAHLGKDSDLSSLRDDARWADVIAAATEKSLEHLAGSNKELAEIYAQDQGDRHGGHGQIDWSKVAPRDAKRRARVDEILKDGGAKTSLDHYHAAMVFQHGGKTDDYQRAHELAVKAVELDSTHSEAKWLAAATKDRLLMSSGKPQLYGTQFRKVGEVWELYEVDPTVTDKERAKWGVPPLAEAQERAAQMNKRP